MDGESSQSDESNKRKKPCQNEKRIESSESNTSDDDSIARSTGAVFDVLTNNTPSIADTDNPLSDPLLVTLQNDESVNVYSSSEMGDDDITNANKRCSVGQIKLVPLENLMPIMDILIELSSGTSTEDEPIDRNISSSKKMLTKARTKPRTSAIELIDSDGSDSDVPIESLRRKTKVNPTNEVPKDMSMVRVKLVKLPTNMEPLLKKYNLSGIFDANNVIASRKRTKCSEVAIMFPQFFRGNNGCSLFYCKRSSFCEKKNHRNYNLMVKTKSICSLYFCRQNRKRNQNAQRAMTVIRAIAISQMHFNQRNR